MVQNSLVKSLADAGEARLMEFVRRPLISGKNYWRPELGISRQNVRAGQPILGAVHWICGFLADQADIDVSLEPGSKLFLDGSTWCFQSAARVAVTRGVLDIRAAEIAVRLVQSQGRWRQAALMAPPESSADRPYLARIEAAGVAGAYPNPFDWSCQAIDGLIPSPDRVNLSEEHAALLPLLEGDSEYAAWITSVVAGIVVTSGDAAVASTDPGFPGLVFLRKASGAAEAAERLVDAASQQKLFQIAMAFPLTEPGREEIHYLPSRRTYTTTRRLLSAALQHVNAIGALVGMRDAVTATESVHELVSARRLLLEAECWPALEASKTLTPHGAVLWAEIKDSALPVLEAVDRKSASRRNTICESTTP
jgi:hypothetical protein